jgi:hypothetical protein
VSELAELRLAIAERRREREAARRRRYDAEIELARFRAGVSATPDEATVQAEVDAAQAAVTAAERALAVARSTYDAAATDEPALWPSSGDLPLLLLPVRLEAIFPEVDGRTELWLRVYPDDIHVDAHELELTEAEHDAGERYWREIWAAGDDQQRRAAAWAALLDTLGLSRASWTLEALRPAGPPPSTPTPAGQTPPDPGPFPEVIIRPEAWSRAARTTLLPDRFVFSAYAGGRLIWRHEGARIPDSLHVGFAPPSEDDEPPLDGLPWDERSRWLVDFDEAVRVGMGRKIRLANPEETFDLLTVVGVSGGDDPEETAHRWQQTLRAHQFTDGLAVLPPGTPTNNTPGTRSGWRTRPQPRPPEEIDSLRADYAVGSDQPAARAARAFGIDGAPVLAAAPDALGGDEALVAEVHTALGAYFGLSFVWRRLDAWMDAGPESVDLPFLVRHFADHVRSRGPLPTLRAGRQPYGVLPVTSLDLWRGDDVDPRILDHVGSFVDALEQRLDRVPRVGDGGDQNALILDLLSREPASRRVRRSFVNTAGQLGFSAPVPGVVGSVPANSAFGRLGPDQGSDALMIVEDDPPEELRSVAALRPLAAKVQLAEDLRTADPADLQGVFDRFEMLRLALEPLERWSGEGTTYTGVFYPLAEDVSHYLFNLAIAASERNEPSEEVEAARRQYARVKQVCDQLVALEERAAADMGGLERVLCEVLDSVSHRVDAWATSVPTARLARQRAERPHGLHAGAYGWLTEVGPGHRDPADEGYVLTPSLHHATTAAVLRSGWRAHDDREALAVDLQSWRVRRALALLDGVRTGQPLAALLGYQFERGLHDAELDQHIARFRTDYPLPLVVEPEEPGSDEARVTIAARNVVDGQALRRRPPDLTRVGDPAASTIRRLIAELDDAVDAVGDLLLAESVHHLVGGNPLRAGLSADAIGRGEGLPSDFEAIRTPRSAMTVTHHLGLLGLSGVEGTDGPGGWNDARPLARLEPGIESWCRHRLGPAGDWRFSCRVPGRDGTGQEIEVTLEALSFSALDVVTAGQPSGASSALVRGILDAAGAGQSAQFTGEGAARASELLLLCGQIRTVLAAGAPLLATHLDPGQPDGWASADLDDLHGRVAPWVNAVIAAAADLQVGLASLQDAVPSETATAAIAEALSTLGGLGIAIPAGADSGTAEESGGAGEVGARVLARLDAAALQPVPPPPRAPEATAEQTRRWASAACAAVSAAAGEHVKVVPVLRQNLPGGGQTPPGADGDAVADWLRGVTGVRPAAAALDSAVVSATVLSGAGEGSLTAVQTAWEAQRPWVATAATPEGQPVRSTVVLHHDGPPNGAALSGLVVDSWTEAIPRPGEHDDPEEVAGVAFHFDRPDSRAPHALLVAVPPDRSRGWRAEDVHGVVEDTLTLARIRSLDLHDVPELRSILPMPGSESA